MNRFLYMDMINKRIKNLKLTLDIYARDYSEQGNIYVLRDYKGGIIFQCLSKKTLEKKIEVLKEEMK